MKNLAAVLISFVASSISGCSGIAALFPPDVPKAPLIKEVRWLEQNWSPEERFWFHHVSQGTSTLPLPYAWFLAIEQPELSLFGTPGLLSNSDYLRRFGFIPSPTHAGAATAHPYTRSDFYGNPDGLPVGFSKTPSYPNPATGEMLPDQIGFTCAACHTGQMEYRGTNIRIDGAPAVTDLGKFRTTLGLALAYTNYVPGRFERFARRVLGENHTAEKKAELEAQLKQLLSRLQQFKKLTDAAEHQGVEEGFARLDALNRIGNQVFFSDLLNAKAQGFDATPNLAVHSAPVNFPHIWNTHWFTWVQYDASIMQPMFRNAGEALGVTAMINLVNPNGTLYKSSVAVRELYEVEQLLAGAPPHSSQPGFNGLRSPAWPEDILGAIDSGRTERGRVLYKDLCQGCHLAPVNEPAFWEDHRWQAPNAVGEQYLKLVEIPVRIIGTDPAQAAVLHTRKVTLPPYLGLDGTSDAGGTVVTNTFGAALAAVVERSVNVWYDEHKLSPSDRDRFNGHRPNLLQAKEIYKARPLNGIWATPPFLHNGSVPTIYSLLSPVEERPKTFCLGNREYDPEQMGYRTECSTGMFQLDTSIDGNHNTGHEFRNGPRGQGVIGRGLSHEERLDLLEFLKRL
ncbi:MAG: hypothetical protein JSS38_17830 [Nitrospira sp.]|nr:hypothetical protein [Nitrospira sp.]